MGSFVWPMLTFFLTTKLGITDYLTSFIIASMSLLALPAAILGGKLADKYDRKKIIVIFDLISELGFTKIHFNFSPNIVELDNNGWYSILLFIILCIII